LFVVGNEEYALSNLELASVGHRDGDIGLREDARKIPEGRDRSKDAADADRQQKVEREQGHTSACRSGGHPTQGASVSFLGCVRNALICGHS
jgi:hypothetical protein